MSREDFDSYLGLQVSGAMPGDVFSFRPVLGPEAQVVEIAAGVRFVCARTATGAVLCWGEGGIDLSPPRGVADDLSFVVPIELPEPVTALRGNRCAAGQSGTTWCWGGAEGRVAQALRE